MLIVGTEWIVDAAGCRAEALRDVARLRGVAARAIAELDLLVAGEEVWHQFPEPGGVTGLVLLTESHLAFHTYPEHGVATINLYCCRARPAWPWAERLGEMLGAREVSVRVVERPALSTLAMQTTTAATAARDAIITPVAVVKTPGAAEAPDAAKMPDAATLMKKTLLPAPARGGKS